MNQNTLEPNLPLAKPSWEAFAQAVASGNSYGQAYKFHVYKAGGNPKKSMCDVNGSRVMKNAIVRARVEWLLEEVARENRARGGMARDDIVVSLSRKYKELERAPCVTMRDRVDQARGLDVLAARICLLTGVQKPKAPAPVIQVEDFSGNSSEERVGGEK